ncbi:hypothetical protein D3C80_996150 [compost metagenome]
MELVNVYCLFGITFTFEYSPAYASATICSELPEHVGVKVALGYNPFEAPLQTKVAIVVKFPPDTQALFAVPQLERIQ